MTEYEDTMIQQMEEIIDLLRKIERNTGSY